MSKSPEQILIKRERMKDARHQAHLHRSKQKIIDPQRYQNIMALQELLTLGFERAKSKIDEIQDSSVSMQPQN